MHYDVVVVEIIVLWMRSYCAATAAAAICDFVLFFILVFTIYSFFIHTSFSLCSLEIWNAYLVCMHVVCLAFSTIWYFVCVQCCMCVCHSDRIPMLPPPLSLASSIIIPIQYHTDISKSQPQISFSLLAGVLSLCCTFLFLSFVFWIDEAMLT